MWLSGRGYIVEDKQRKMKAILTGLLLSVPILGLLFLLASFICERG